MSYAKDLREREKAVVDHEQSYKGMVSFHSEQHDNADIVSFGAEDSTYVFTKLFDNTREEICMLTGSLSGDVSNKMDYYYSLRECLLKGVKIKVLFLNGRAHNSQVISLLESFIDKKQVEMKDATETAKGYLTEQFKKQKTICHFTALDNDKYRFEYDPENFNSISNFNDKDKNHRLREIFKTAWNL